MRLLLLAGAILSFSGSVARAQEGPKRTPDVIYAHKQGVALTFDVFQPATPNGAGVLQIQSGGWFSSHNNLKPQDELIRRGYTVFLVVHGSQPRFQIPDIVEDIHRAARFIRSNAATWKVDPNKLGVTGGSAGCHLSLMLAAQGAPGPDDAKDPIDRASSAVQAAACLYPPTDFLNYGRVGDVAVGVGLLRTFKPAFGPRSDDPDERRVYGREISPVYFVTRSLPPTLLIHGDADKLVPIQQAQIFVARAKSVGATARLVVKPGKGHGWPDMQPDLALFADWFDEHLRGQKKPAR